MIGPARRLAAHDGTGVLRWQRVRRVRHRVGRRIHIEEQRARNFRPVRLRVVQRAAVVDGDGAGGPFQIVHLAHVDRGSFGGLEASRPFALLIVLIDDGTVVTAAQDPERPLLRVALVDVCACGARRVVGVRPGRNVLVPLHLVAAFRPFEVELRVVELDVGTDEVRDRIRQRRLGARRIFPERGVMVIHAGETPQTRVLACVGLVDVPHGVRRRYRPAAIDHLLGGSPQPLDPVVAQELLQQHVAVLEVELALLLGQNLWLQSQHLFWGHRPTSSHAVLHAAEAAGQSLTDISIVRQLNSSWQPPCDCHRLRGRGAVRRAASHHPAGATLGRSLSHFSSCCTAKIDV